GASAGVAAVSETLKYLENRSVHAVPSVSASSVSDVRETTESVGFTETRFRLFCESVQPWEIIGGKDSEVYKAFEKYAGVGRVIFIVARPDTDGVLIEERNTSDGMRYFEIAGKTDRDLMQRLSEMEKNGQITDKDMLVIKYTGEVESTINYDVFADKYEKIKTYKPDQDEDPWGGWDWTSWAFQLALSLGEDGVLSSQGVYLGTSIGRGQGLGRKILDIRQNIFKKYLPGAPFYSVVANVITAEIFSQYFDAEFVTDSDWYGDYNLRYLEIARELGLVSEEEFTAWKDQKWLPLLKEKIDGLQKHIPGKNKTAFRYFLDRLDDYAKRAVVGERIRAIVSIDEKSINPVFENFIKTLLSENILVISHYEPKDASKVMWSFPTGDAEKEAVNRLLSYIEAKGISSRISRVLYEGRRDWRVKNELREKLIASASSAVYSEFAYAGQRDYREKNELKGLRYNPGHWDDYGLEVIGRVPEAPAAENVSQLAQTGTKILEGIVWGMSLIPGANLASAGTMKVLDLA
ncbi:MAG TPA: hypothetical protein VJC03_06770, partial [bacterium]|nr:hypothetical protein [bacterium]